MSSWVPIESTCSGGTFIFSQQRNYPLNGDKKNLDKIQSNNLGHGEGCEILQDTGCLQVKGNG